MLREEYIYILYYNFMFTKNTCTKERLIIMTLEDIVPKDDIFRKIDKYIKFNFIRVTKKYINKSEAKLFFY